MEQKSSFEQSVNSSDLQRPKRRSCWFYGSIFGCLFLLLIFIGLPISIILLGDKVTSYQSGEVVEKIQSGSSENKIAIIKIHGLIVTNPTTQVDSIAASDIKKMIDKAEADSAVKAVIVDIDSPGGTMVGSSLIYKYFRDFSKPIISLYSGDVAASGGVYASMGTDTIVANPETLTGSIGVVMETYDLSGLLNKYGIKFNTIKSAKLKDIGSYSRPMTDEERSLLQGIIDESYDQFVKIIASSRKLTEDQVHQFADGRIFSSRKAEELGLVDKLGYQDDAEAMVKKMAGITEAQIIEYQPPFSFSNFLQLLTTKFGKLDPLSLISQNKKNSSLALYYLMR